MAQRSNRRFLNPISVEVFRDRLTNRKESGRNPSWPGALDSTKGRIHWRRPPRHLYFPLAILRRTIHSDNRNNGIWIIFRWRRDIVEISEIWFCRKSNCQRRANRIPCAVQRFHIATTVTQMNSTVPLASLCLNAVSTPVTVQKVAAGMNLATSTRPE